MELTQRQLKRVIDRLNALGKGRKPLKATVGICSDIRNSCGIFIHVVPGYYDIVRKWTLYAGHEGYPVPHPKMDSVMAYMGNGHWEGEYGKNRRALCRYLATEFKKILLTLPE
jgi:hypothetical protein